MEMMDATTQAVKSSSAKERPSHQGQPSTPPTIPFIINIQMDGFQGCFNWFDTRNWYLCKLGYNN